MGCHSDPKLFVWQWILWLSVRRADLSCRRWSPHDRTSKWNTTYQMRCHQWKICLIFQVSVASHWFCMLAYNLITSRLWSGQPSAWIPYTASATMVQAALLTIPGVTGVVVTFSEPRSPVCNPVSNIVSIQFTQQFGPLPPLVPQLDATMKNSGLFVLN